MANEPDGPKPPAPARKKRTAAKKKSKMSGPKPKGEPKTTSNPGSPASFPVGIASVSGVGSKAPGPAGMKILTFVADFLPPAPLPAGAEVPTVFPTPMVQLQIPNGAGGWTNFGVPNVMIVVIANQRYQFVSSPVPDNSYQAVVTARWQVMVPDSGTIGPI